MASSISDDKRSTSTLDEKLDAERQGAPRPPLPLLHCTHLLFYSPNHTRGCRL